MNLKELDVRTNNVPTLLRCDLIVIGMRGKVGSSLLTLLSRQKEKLLEDIGLELRLVAAFDRRGIIHNVDGIDTSNITEMIRPRFSGDLDEMWRSVEATVLPTIIIDCTASDDIAGMYLSWLSHGFGIVAANKRANARDIAYYLSLQNAARKNAVPYRYETTVGAAIPLLGPLRDLRMRGESIRSITGVLSGSLSYILHRLHENCKFSEAILEARSLGYTEPNPFEDLHAIDLGRKLLVLAREAGFMHELTDLEIQPLSHIKGCKIENLSETLQEEDVLWRNRIDAAACNEQRLAVIVEIDHAGGRVAVKQVPRESVFAQVRPGQNVISIATDLQYTVPFYVSGPGAGIEVTAAGVLTDVIAAALQWGRVHHTLAGLPRS